MPRKRNTDLNRKEPVLLRQRRIKNGGYSLYLDTYWNGKRSYDFLNLYLNPPTDEKYLKPKAWKLLIIFKMKLHFLYTAMGDS